jgi:hypothetical protein
VSLYLAIDGFRASISRCLDNHSSCLLSHTLFIIKLIAYSAVEYVLVVSSKERDSLAARSASSFPQIPLCPGTHSRFMFLFSFIRLAMVLVLGLLLALICPTAVRQLSESDTMSMFSGYCSSACRSAYIMACYFVLKTDVMSVSLSAIVSFGRIATQVRLQMIHL